MRLFFKYFFKIAQYIIGPIMLLWDKLTSPRGIVRSPEDQQQIDASTKNLVLYEFRMCPFCIKARRGDTTWMYESSDIIAYLQQRFA